MLTDNDFQLSLISSLISEHSTLFTISVPKMPFDIPQETHALTEYMSPTHTHNHCTLSEMPRQTFKLVKVRGKVQCCCESEGSTLIEESFVHINFHWK